MLKGIKVTAIVIISLLMLIWLTCTLLLNHAQDLKLDQYKLTNSWLLERYQRTDVPVEQGWRLTGQLFMQILATDDNLILFDTEGEYISTLGAAELIPAEIQNIGLHHGLPVLQTRSGMWQGNSILDDWQLISLQGVSWSESISIPESTKNELRLQLEAHNIKLTTLLEDICNGRFFGEQGRWLIDALLLLIMVLAVRGMFGLTDKA